MIFGILPLLVLGGIIALVVRIAGRRGERSASEQAGSSVRRFFQYALMYGVLVVVAIGVTGLLSEIMPGGEAELTTDRAALARSLAFVIIGAPVFVGLALWTRRLLDTEEGERASFGWTLYLGAATLTALWTAGWGIFEVLAWLFRAEDFDPGTLAIAIVWTPVWAVHWWIADHHGDRTRLRLATLAGSGTGLIALATAVGGALTTALGSIYEAAFETSVVSNLSDDLGMAGAGFLVGAAIWWWYWLRHAATDERESVWHAYVLLVGVLGGLVTAIVAVAAVLYALLEWAFGNPTAINAAQQFDIVPASIGSGAVAAWVWWYHRAVLRSRPETTRVEVDRVYDYLIAGVGLVAATGGITTVVVALIEALSPAGIVEVGSSAANTLVTAVTLLLVGGPIWWIFWSRIQQLRDGNTAVELQSPTRRVYLFALFGVGGLVALIALLVLTVNGIEAVIEGRFGAETIRDVRVSIALVLTLGALAGYHWTVYGHDRDEAPAESRPIVRDVVLVGTNGAALASAIEDQLGARVRVWRRLDSPTRDVDPDAALAALRVERHEHVLVVAGPSGVQVVPFEES